jgi:transketolase
MPRKDVMKVYEAGSEFTFGKANELRDGEQVTIIASGILVDEALQAADLLAGEGISAAVLDMFPWKPLDTEAVAKWAAKTGALVTAENHNIIGGLGSAVCEVAAELGCGRVRRIGVQDRFGESAPYERLLEKNGITAENIVRIVKELL